MCFVYVYYFAFSNRKVAQLCVKAADLGHGLVDWKQHVEWSSRITEEFYQQVSFLDGFALVIFFSSLKRVIQNVMCFRAFFCCRETRKKTLE